MGDPCAVCAHRDIIEINKRLASSDSVEDIAADYALSENDLFEHKQVHIYTANASEDDELDEEIYCYYCEKPLDELEIADWVPESYNSDGYYNYRPICEDCVEEDLSEDNPKDDIDE